MLITCLCMESSIYGRYFWVGEEVIIANVPMVVVKPLSKKRGKSKYDKNSTFNVCEWIFQL